MKIKELKKELGISNADIAEFFNLSKNSYQNSSAKQRYENALCKFYALIKSRESVCDCGKPIDSRYAPCCSLKCWDKKFL